MNTPITTAIQQDGKWFIGFCPEVPGANGQGTSEEECRENLSQAVALMLEDRPEDALGRQ